jgi:dihydrofolate synthase/folylpolyglutamate synthase
MGQRDKPSVPLLVTYNLRRNNMSRYQEVVDFIESIPRFTKKTKLENTNILLERLGDPDKAFKTVHIAGTNGKGSVAKLMSMFLIKSGRKTGLFTSPHLVKMNERFNIDGNDISDDRFVELFDKLKKAVDEAVAEDVIQHPAYFEFLFCMSALYFADEGCDFVVYETGLGGRLDATNVILPEVSIITSIGFDHMQYLGDTIEKIAGEKAGIIKPGIPVIYNTGDCTADKVILKTAIEKKSAAYSVTDYWDHDLDSISEEIKNSDLALQIKTFSSMINEKTSDMVPYQRQNIRTAITAWTVLNKEAEATISPDVFAEVIGDFYWPGRMEYIAPNVLIDGAHNEDAIVQFISGVKFEMKKAGWKKVSLLFAVSSDKDYESIIKLLCEGLEFEDVYVTELASVRKTDIQEEMKLFHKYMPAEKHFDVVGTRNIDKAFTLAKSETDDDTLLVAVGSLYMVGELEKLKNN